MLNPTRAAHLRVAARRYFTPVLLLHRHTVPAAYGKAERLDTYLCGIWEALPSRKSIQKALKRGAVRLRGAPLTSAHRVSGGEVYELWATEERPGARDYAFRHAVVYEDHWLAVLHKPAGWVVSGNQFKTVQNCLRVSLTTTPLPDALDWPRPVHRLDAPTSGLLLVAKTRSAHAALGELFARRTVAKTYHAVVAGYLPDSGSIHSPLDGKTAHTAYTAISRVRSLRNDWLTLTKIRLHTGRTHQIRKHLAAGGYPLCGDQLYQPNGGATFKGKGLMLAATGLAFKHPATKAALALELPVPSKFGSLLRREARRWAKYR